MIYGGVIIDNFYGGYRHCFTIATPPHKTLRSFSKTIL
jgi:hypothetical protein